MWSLLPIFNALLTNSPLVKLEATDYCVNSTNVYVRICLDSKITDWWNDSVESSCYAKPYTVCKHDSWLTNQPRKPKFLHPSSELHIPRMNKNGAVCFLRCLQRVLISDIWINRQLELFAYWILTCMNRCINFQVFSLLLQGTLRYKIPFTYVVAVTGLIVGKMCDVTRHS